MNKDIDKQLDEILERIEYQFSGKTLRWARGELERLMVLERIDTLEQLLAVPDGIPVKEEQVPPNSLGIKGGVGRVDSSKLITPAEAIKHRIAELQHSLDGQEKT